MPMGNNFWEDFDIDVQTIKMEVAAQAKELLDQYGEDLTREDILQLSGNKSWAQGGTSQALAAKILEGYKERCIVLKEPEAVENPETPGRLRFINWFKKGLK